MVSESWSQALSTRGSDEQRMKFKMSAKARHVARSLSYILYGIRSAVSARAVSLSSLFLVCTHTSTASAVFSSSHLRQYAGNAQRRLLISRSSFVSDALFHLPLRQSVPYTVSPPLSHRKTRPFRRVYLPNLFRHDTRIDYLVSRSTCY